MHNLMTTQSKTTPSIKQEQTMTNAAKGQILKSGLMDERQLAQYSAAVAVSIFKLRTAFHTQARNFRESEIDALNALWLETFSNFRPEDIQEAVLRFIKDDRKGFFPSPGQVEGFVEQIVKERKAQEKSVEYWAKEVARRHRLMAAMEELRKTQSHVNDVGAVTEEMWDALKKRALEKQEGVE